jgi:spore maturation protein CgeB
MTTPARVLLVCNPGNMHLGQRFMYAAAELGVAWQIADVRHAFQGPRLAQALLWKVAKRPYRLKEFSASVLETCRSFHATVVLSLGLCAVDKECLLKLSGMGITTSAFLTDDPWSPAHRAAWLLEALPAYSMVFTPRVATLTDLSRLGCQNVRLLRFGFGRDIHFIEAPAQAELERYSSDVVFIGGGDRDRIQYMKGLIESGLSVALYGGYWERYRATATSSKGNVDGCALRHAVHGAKCTVCLVRKANRDSHCMRTFEMPAMGGACLMEDTDDHRELFGSDGDSVLYFRTPSELRARVRWAIERPDLRRDLSRNANAIVVQGGHSYTDRLREILVTLHGDERLGL